MRVLGTLISLSIGVIVGQYSMRLAYDPDVLEGDALKFALESHYIGCKGAGATNEFCFYTSDAYIKTVESIWHNKAWKGDKVNEQD